jgi:hypothetical protein
MQIGQPETPEATEAPGRSGDQARIKKIQQDRALLGNVLQNLYDIRDKWRSSSVFTRWHNKALYGRDVEPPDMMYKRHDAITDLLKTDAMLAEEERLLTMPSPTAQSDASDAARREARAAQMNWLDKFNQQRGLPMVPQEIQLQYIEKGYGLDQAAAKDGEDDIIKQLTGAAKFGQEVGAEAAAELAPDRDNLRKSAVAGAKYGAKVRAESKDGGEEKGKYAGFDTMAQLTSAVGAAEEDISETLKEEVEENGYFINPMTGMREAGKVFNKRLTESGAKEARKRALATFPGAEKWLPNYINQQAPEPVQMDVNKIKIRQRLAEQVGKGKAAGK